MALRPEVFGACFTNHFVLSLCGVLAGYHCEGTLTYMWLRSKWEHEHIWVVERVNCYWTSLVLFYILSAPSLSLATLAETSTNKVLICFALNPASGPYCIPLSTALGFSDVMAWHCHSNSLGTQARITWEGADHVCGASFEQWGQEFLQKVLWCYGSPTVVVNLIKTHGFIDFSSFSVLLDLPFSPAPWDHLPNELPSLKSLSQPLLIENSV